MSDDGLVFTLIVKSTNGQPLEPGAIAEGLKEVTKVLNNQDDFGEPSSSSVN